MLNVIIGEDLYDHEFCDKWVFGLDELAERVADKTPEWAEGITWVPADVIRGAARAFATNAPSSIMWGLAIDTQQNGAQAGQALLSIGAICGYMDVPGGITLALPSSFLGRWTYETMQFVGKEVEKKRIDAKEDHPAYATGPYAHPDSVLTTLETGEPLRLPHVLLLCVQPHIPDVLRRTRALVQRHHEDGLQRRAGLLHDPHHHGPVRFGAAGEFLPRA